LSFLAQLIPPEGCISCHRCPEKDEHIGCGVENALKLDLSGNHYMIYLSFMKERKSCKEMTYISD